jgi:hypothetical protein
MTIHNLHGDCLANSEVITIRVPKGTKAFIKKEKIKPSTEFRELINAKRNMVVLLKEYAKIEARAKKRKVSGDSTEMIREDRDSR